MSRNAPVKIHRWAGGFFGVDWSDGNRTILPYRWLRGQCPCAGCVDEWTGVRTVGEADIPFDVAPVKVSSVGRHHPRSQHAELELFEHRAQRHREHLPGELGSD